MLIRIDKKGDMDRVSSLIADRAGSVITPARLNEGMKVDLQRVCDQATADRLRAVYQMDYDAFGFEPRQFAAHVEPFVLSDVETRLVYQLRGVMERLQSVSRAASTQAGARYGVKQIRNAFVRRGTVGRRYTDYRLLDS
jgi:hypothetical protein